MEEAKQYIQDYQNATSSEEKAALLANYELFLKTLSVHDREQVRQFMQTTLRPQIQQTVKTLDTLAEKAEQLLNQKSYV